MTKYRCVKRLSTDSMETIHEVGDIVDLSGVHEKVALQHGAVEPVKEPKKSEGDV